MYPRSESKNIYLSYSLSVDPMLISLLILLIINVLQYSGQLADTDTDRPQKTQKDN